MTKFDTKSKVPTQPGCHNRFYASSSGMWAEGIGALTYGTS